MNNRCYLCAFCDWYMKPGTGKVFWLPAETGHTVDLIKAAHDERCTRWYESRRDRAFLPTKYLLNGDIVLTGSGWRLLTDSATPESILAALDELRSVYRWKLSQGARAWLSNSYNHAWAEFPSELVEGMTFPLPEHLDNLPEYKSHLSRTPEQVKAYIRLLAHNYTEGISPARTT